MSSCSSVDRAPARCSGGHGLNFCRTQIFSLSHSRVMLISSPFTFHYRAQNSPSLLTCQCGMCLFNLGCTSHWMIFSEWYRTLPIFCWRLTSLITHHQTQCYLHLSLYVHSILLNMIYIELCYIQYIIYTSSLEQFSTEVCNTQTKEITLASQKGHRQLGKTSKLEGNACSLCKVQKNVFEVEWPLIFDFWLDDNVTCFLR